MRKGMVHYKKEIARCYRLIQRKLGIGIPIDEPVKYVSKIALGAGLNQKTQNLAIELLQQAKTRKAVVGKAPTGIAAAALYIAAIMRGDDITQNALAAASGMTEVTVRNRYKRLAQDLELHVK